VDTQEALLIRPAMTNTCIAVIIPCYKVKKMVLGVIRRIGPEVALIYAVDDACPDESGRFIMENCTDPRVKVVFNIQNMGVGGAVIAGYKAALADGATILVKIDGDGQMPPELLSDFVEPIMHHEADYTKGNRFYSYYNVRTMPKVRLFGNAVLSFMTKMSSGYWGVFDPTNGYTAIHKTALSRIDLSTLSKRYFFETDMLVKLGAERAVILDIPMEAVYGEEESGLKVSKIIPEFMRKHLFELCRRIIYSYFVRDFSFASVALFFGVVLTAFGTIFGATAWAESIRTGHIATTGTVILSALPVIIGFQLLMSFLAFDIANQPRVPLSTLIRSRKQPE